MNKLHLPMGFAVGCALAVAGCTNGSSDDAAKANDKGFKDYFGRPSVEHQWNMAQAAHVTVLCPDNALLLRVILPYDKMYYQLACVNKPAAMEVLQFDIPIDVEDFVVVVDDYEYGGRSGDIIDATAHDGTYAKIADYNKAPSLGWIIAVEVPDGDDNSDYDYNDVVMRVDRCMDGSLDITPLAVGLESDVWMHFMTVNGDYVLSPNAPNKCCEEIYYVQNELAQNYELHNWFEYVVGPVNVGALGGVDEAKGRKVNLPVAILGSMGFTLSDASTSDTDRMGDILYDKPTWGFYFSAGAVDYTSPDAGVSADDAIAVCRPEGREPRVLIFPDINENDTRRRQIGWQWPTEGSRIDMVYPQFIPWVSDKYVNWYYYSPLGVANQAGYADDSGMFVRYGYYSR